MYSLSCYCISLPPPTAVPSTALSRGYFFVFSFLSPRAANQTNRLFVSPFFLRLWCFYCLKSPENRNIFLVGRTISGILSVSLSLSSSSFTVVPSSSSASSSLCEFELLRRSRTRRHCRRANERATTTAAVASSRIII